jgi:predicted GNAT family acetyltransferase
MKFLHETNRIYATDENEKIIAEVTFPNVGVNLVNINHTFVDNSLRGQGIASLLMEEAYKEIKKQNKRALATCSYAVKWFEKNTSKKDIIADKIF